MERQLAAWLQSLGMGKYALAFAENDIDLDALPHLSDDDLKELGLTLGHRRKLQAALKLLGDDTMPTTAGDAVLQADAVSGPVAAVFVTERKIATVLFCDICESTRLIAGLDAEAAAERLSPIVHVMKEAVRLYGGTVNKIQGDGIMAIFGAPLALEDHAVRACYAAVAARDAVTEQSTLGMQVRTGINSGEIVVRGVKNDFTEDYDALGEAVHVASRMESLADPGTIRLAQTTRDLASGFVDVRPYGPTLIRGLVEPIETFELLAVKGSWTRWDVRSAEPLTPMVGRQAELAALQRAADSAEAGIGRVVGIAGYPGIGKSRLAYEYSRIAEQRGWVVWQSGASPVIQHAPYLMFTRLLRVLCHVPDDAKPAEVRESIVRWLSEVDRGLLDYLPAFEFLLNLEPSDPEWLDMNGEARRQQAIQAISTLVFAKSERVPLVLLLEDLHWSDQESLRLIDAIVDIVPAASVLLVATYRTEFRPAWEDRSYFTLLRLSPLGKTNADQMLESLLGSDDSTRELLALLADRTEGRPLFIEEIIRSLIESGAVAGEPGQYRRMQDISEIQIPESVQAVIAARVDRLDPDQKRILQCAAAVGRRISVELLRDLGGWSDEEYHELLRSLQAAELIFQRTVFPRPELAFKHSLTMEVAYASLPMAGRKQLHARLFELIEQGDYYRQEDRVDRLAYHALSAELWEEAARYLEMAAARAFATSAHEDAARLLEQAMAAQRHLEETFEAARWAIDIRLKLRAAYGALAQLKHTKHQLAEARELALHIGDRPRLARVLTHETVHEYLHGDIRQAIEIGEEALALAEDCGERDQMLLANLFLGIACRFRGDYRRSSATLKRMLHEFADDPTNRHGAAGTTSVLYLANLAQSEASMGNFEIGRRFALEACEIAETVDRPFDLAIAHRVVGHGLMMRGAWSEALPHLRRGLQAARSARITIFIPYNACFLGYVYAQLGRLEDASDLLEEAEAELRDKQFASYLAFPSVYMTEIYRKMGHLETALGLARRALDFTRAGGYQGAEAVALRSMAEVLLDHDPPILQPSRGFLEQSVDLSEELGLRPHRVRAQRVLARALRLAGDGARADALLATAADEAAILGLAD